MATAEKASGPDSEKHAYDRISQEINDLQLKTSTTTLELCRRDYKDLLKIHDLQLVISQHQKFTIAADMVLIFLSTGLILFQLHVIWDFCYNSCRHDRKSPSTYQFDRDDVLKLLFYVVNSIHPFGVVLITVRRVVLMVGGTKMHSRAQTRKDTRRLRTLLVTCFPTVVMILMLRHFPRIFGLIDEFLRSLPWLPIAVADGNAS